MIWHSYILKSKEFASIIANYYSGVKVWSSNTLNAVKLNESLQIEVSGTCNVGLYRHYAMAIYTVYESSRIEEAYQQLIDDDIGDSTIEVLIDRNISAYFIARVFGMSTKQVLKKTAIPTGTCRVTPESHQYLLSCSS